MISEFDFDRFQLEVRDWHTKNYRRETNDQSVMSICEEAGEVCRAQLKQSGNLRGTWDYWQAEKAKELGDVMIAVINVCARNGFSWNDVLLQRWDIISHRDYVKNPFDGGREDEDDQKPL
jgi:NTP pyrophosphatase (non-canonical NTP hydrolase)